MEKARILIVEDEAIIAMEIESQLQSLGYKVTSIVEYWMVNDLKNKSRQT